jgi:O-methyltransferase
MKIKSLIKRVINKLGFEIHRMPSPPSNPEYYEVVRPSATYSPWNKDSAFQEIYTAIQGFTLVDRYRCFELWTLVEQSSKLEDGSIIEVGVWRGGTGALIAKQATNCGITNPVYLCDTFTGVVKASPKDSTYKGGEHADASRQIVEDLIFNQMKLDNVQILEGIFPDQTSYVIEQQKFRFCHIDVDVYQSAKDVVDWIWDKMVHGGIIVYDDYGFEKCNGVAKYVEEQIKYKDRLVLHNLNGHAVVVKL